MTIDPVQDAEDGLKAVEALHRGQRLAVEAGLDKMTIEEIDAEIQAVRALRQKRKNLKEG